MSGPLVLALMLTKDRHAMAQQAVECFKAQTYANKRLLVFDTGSVPFVGPDFEFDWLRRQDGEEFGVGPESHAFSIGELRNHAIECMYADIIVHWDDDDLSHLNRITEQVALLQSSGADIVGYNQVLFWRQDSRHWGHGQQYPAGMVNCRCGNVFPRTAGFCDKCQRHALEGGGEAWLYTRNKVNYAIGSSLMYWRRVWTDRPFKALPTNSQSTGEETPFMRDRKVVAVSSNPIGYPDLGDYPRLICRIHGSNTAHYDIEEQIKRGSTEWSRVPGWDDYCRKVMG